LWGRSPTKSSFKTAPTTRDCYKIVAEGLNHALVLHIMQ
jgi:hypothetical protein